ncbi:MAG: ABC transporter ATP-binding protein [Actinomycetota bacterium]|nr:ABC transporter ATP-binding protein [Actinomycetota bacterium]
MLRAELQDTIGDAELHVVLSVAPGRCLALAGPSGAGKTTVLRLLAGTRRPVAGQIRAGERLWVDTHAGVWVAPERRRCGYMFQEYALFPHLSAWRNVAYGMRTGSRGPRRARALELLERLGMGSRAQARPATLSGGERQRVALARALACEPSVLLLDEPLSALDSRSRVESTRHLAEALRSLQVPAVLVTHDFGEAASLGDEVGILDAGRVVQLGSASELASVPASAFVADFTGAVVLSGTVLPGGSGLTVVALDGGGTASTTDRDLGGGRVALSVYPWEIGLSAVTRRPAGGSPRNHLGARIGSITRLGNRVRVGLDGGQPLVAEITADAASELELAVGQEVTATWKATATRLVPL